MENLEIRSLISIQSAAKYWETKSIRRAENCWPSERNSFVFRRLWKFLMAEHIHTSIWMFVSRRQFWEQTFCFIFFIFNLHFFSMCRTSGCVYVFNRCKVHKIRRWSRNYLLHKSPIFPLCHPRGCVAFGWFHPTRKSETFSGVFGFFREEKLSGFIVFVLKQRQMFSCITHFALSLVMQWHIMCEAQKFMPGGVPAFSFSLASFFVVNI